MEKIYQIIIENFYHEAFTNIFIGISFYTSYQIYKKVRSYFTTPDPKEQVDKSTNTDPQEKLDKSTNTELKETPDSSTSPEPANPEPQPSSEIQPSEIQPREHPIDIQTEDEEMDPLTNLRNFFEGRQLPPRSQTNIFDRDQRQRNQGHRPLQPMNQRMKENIEQLKELINRRTENRPRSTRPLRESTKQKSSWANSWANLKIGVLEGVIKSINYFEKIIKP